MADHSPFPTQSPLLVVAAHPDDEVIGLGGMLCRRKDVIFIKATDGAPQDPRFSLAAGFSNRSEYAAARHGELLDALKLVQIGPVQIRSMVFADQEIMFNLAVFVRALKQFLLDIRPTAVITHPYEGGHPDHDGAAFAVYAACKLAERESGFQTARMEFTSYHLELNRLVVAEFLPYRGKEIITMKLTNTEQETKKQMVECFRSQQDILRRFPLHVEKFRQAPNYDFSRPPHAGPLLYETFGWGIRGRDFNQQATEAAKILGLDGPAGTVQDRSA
jgi:LmbE family N-acetylglucosaminyl deacetylase